MYDTMSCHSVLDAKLHKSGVASNTERHDTIRV